MQKFSAGTKEELMRLLPVQMGAAHHHAPFGLLATRIDSQPLNT
jgi:hypothetical protein